MLLQTLPDSRLEVGGIESGDEAALRERFGNSRIDGDRIRCHPRKNVSEYLALHHQVDICLDTFPHGGGATTAYAAWMGVPTLCLVGETPASRFSATLLHQLGLDAFITRSIEEFVECGVHWASQVEELATLRCGLRQHMQQSMLGRAQEFAAKFDAMLRGQWKQWCAGQTPTPRASEMEDSSTK
jgi:predicted O-linked N-acetylglucosamine transferase (SPINDLY family)